MLHVTSQDNLIHQLVTFRPSIRDTQHKYTLHEEMCKQGQQYKAKAGQLKLKALLGSKYYIYTSRAIISTAEELYSRTKCMQNGLNHLVKHN